MIRKYERLDILHENTLKPRTHYILYDTPENALEAIKELANGYNIEYLHYNTMAGAKYPMIGKEFKFEDYN